MTPISTRPVSVQDVAIDNPRSVDLALFYASFGTREPTYDFDNTGKVDLGDFLILADALSH